MNWYKEAQLNKEAGTTFGELVSYFGAALLIGYMGVQAINESGLREKIEVNPQQTIQEIQQFKDQQEQNIYQTVDTPETQQNQDSRFFGLQQKPEQEDMSEEEYEQSNDALTSMLERHEGKRNKMYRDTKGIPHIGIGFNLTKPTAEKQLRSVGANMSDITRGKPITDEQIYQLLKQDTEVAVNDAKQFLPNFAEQPTVVQHILINMSFNIGINRLSQFKKFQKALLYKDYQTAAEEMIDSRWYHQTGNRSKELVELMKGVR